ncbi:MAG TPA: DUF2127 domain-containing protein [Gemmatimonadales bacterium]|nr:DUF2127 domain-containing protein [Gemmatimonadales bacterium]
MRPLADRRALRTVAVLEAGKGALVVAAGTALLRAGPAGAQAFAERLVRHLHLDPARHTPRIFLAAAERLTEPRLRWLAAGAAAYALVRFAEAFGLWRGAPWARAFGVATGALYVPLEVRELWRHPSWVSVVTLLLNVVVVVVLWRAHLNGNASPAHAASGGSSESIA